MRIIFAGTPDFSVPVLQALLDADHDICAVYTQPDRPKGRGRKMTYSPVKQRAMELGLEVVQPKSLKNEPAQQQMAAFDAELMVVVAYGLLLPKAVLSIPTRGCINVHASLLPKYRGASPIQAAILAGDKQTGITIMQMDVGLDTGDMILKKNCLIEPDDTSQTLHDKLATIGANAIVETLSQLSQAKAIFEKQDDSQASYAGKISKEDACIDWHKQAIDIERTIRAYNPWPVSYSLLNQKKVRIWQASIFDTVDTAKYQAGQIIEVGKARLLIACGSGILSVETIQLEGSKPMPIKDCLNAKRALFVEGQCFANS